MEASRCELFFKGTETQMEIEDESIIGQMPGRMDCQCRLSVECQHPLKGSRGQRVPAGFPVG